MSIDKSHKIPPECAGPQGPNYLRRRLVAVCTGAVIVASVLAPLFEKVGNEIDVAIHRDDPVCELSGVVIVKPGGTISGIAELADPAGPEGNRPFLLVDVTHQYKELTAITPATLQPGLHPGIICTRLGDEPTAPNAP